MWLLTTRSEFDSLTTYQTLEAANAVATVLWLTESLDDVLSRMTSSFLELTKEY